MSGHDDSPTSLIHASTAFDSTGIISLQYLIANLGLKMHPEGGYYVETDRDPLQVPNPFLLQDQEKPASTSPSGSLLLPPPPLKQQLAEEPLGDNSTRSAGTSIYYLLTPGDPKGSFHRNKGRTIHTLYQGRGRYVIIHADEVQSGGKARIETFVVGHNVQNGERLQWVVEGGKYKASFLLPDGEDSSTSKGLLISEVMRIHLSPTSCSRPFLSFLLSFLSQSAVRAYIHF